VVEGKDILCYVHSVSPLKQSNQTSYFTAQLQTSPQQVVRVVSFSPKKRSDFCKHQDAKSPVKISKFKLSSKKGSDDVVINNNTSIESIEGLTFPHREISSSTESTISSLQKVSVEQLVSVHAKVVKLSAVKVLQTTHGSLKKQEGIIVDKTSSIKLVLWETHVDCLEEGKTYNLNNLRLKENRGEKYVNTPKTGEFTFKVAEDLGQLAATDDIELETVRTITATIIGVSSVTKSMGCVACKGKVEEKDVMIAVCNSCKMRQKTSACRSSWFASIIVQSEDDSSKNIRLAMFNSQIVKLLNVSRSPITLATASTEDVSDEILLLDDTLSITYDSMKNHLVDVNIVDI
jgi:hypothetical protein